MAYIYFTRIVVFLLAATIPFYLLWLGAMFTELATLLFFVVTGYKFKPAKDNPYLPVRAEDTEGGEYGLEGDQGEERSMGGTDGSIGVDGKALRTTPSGEATMGVQMLPLR